MGRRFLGLSLLAVVVALVACGSAAAAPRIFTVAAGDGRSAQLRLGGPATSRGLSPDHVVGLPDSGFAFSDIYETRVFRVDRQGRLSVLAGNGRFDPAGDGRPAAEAAVGLLEGLEVFDGGVLMFGDPGVGGGIIRRVRPDGIIETVRGTVRDELGLVSPQDVSVAPDGSLLVAHFERVWRVARDGTLTVFAGDGRRVHDGDGGPATDAGIEWPAAVEAVPDGTVFIAQDDERLRRVALDGTISTVPGSFGFSDLAVAPGGVLIGAATLFPVDGQPPEGSRVFAVDRDGRKTLLAGGGPRPGFDGDGGDATAAGIYARDVSVASDGGVLIADVNTVRYLAPEHPSLLAVAITRPTLTSPRRVRVSLATTLPATISVRVGRRPRVLREVSGGDAVITLPGGPVRSGTSVVRVVARGGNGEVATDRQVIFPGGRLTLDSARQLARRAGASWTDLLAPPKPRRVGGWDRRPVGGCQRFARARIDCRLSTEARCQRFVSVRLRLGVPFLRFYRDRRCRFQAHPLGRDRAVTPF